MKYETKRTDVIVTEEDFREIVSGYGNAKDIINVTIKEELHIAEKITIVPNIKRI